MSFSVHSRSAGPKQCSRTHKQPGAAAPLVPGSAAASSRARRRHVAASAFPGEPGSWGEQIRAPDTARNLDQDDRPGPQQDDLDLEWQEFISGKGRYTQPQPLMWDQDSHGSSNWPSASDSSSGGSSSSGRRPEPSGSSSSHYSSSIQSFDDWDNLEGDHTLTRPSNVQQVNEALPMPASSSLASSSSSNPAAAAAAAASIPSLAGSAGAHSFWGSALQPSRDVLSPADLLGSRGVGQDMHEVYVLLFGVGQKDTEGIYSLRAVSEDGLPTETIIAFQNMDDAVRYAALLEATMEHSPHVCSIPPAELMAFCSDSGYRCRLELEGSLLMPPEYNVHVTDWERSLRLREGKFHVLQDEPDAAASPAADAADGALTFMGLPSGISMGSMAGYSLSRDSPYFGLFEGPAAGGELTSSELDSLRAQLEALLPATPSSDEDDLQLDS